MKRRLSGASNVTELAIGLVTQHYAGPTLSGF